MAGRVPGTVDLQHGNLTISLPASWQDQSTLLFVGPPRPGSLPTPGRVDESPDAVSVTFVVGGMSPQGYLNDQAALLKQSGTGFSVVREGPFESPVGAAWHQEQTLTIQGQVVRQMVMAVAVGPVLITATAGTSAGRFEQSRAGLVRVLQSIRLGGSA